MKKVVVKKYSIDVDGDDGNDFLSVIKMAAHHA